MKYVWYIVLTMAILGMLAMGLQLLGRRGEVVSTKTVTSKMEPVNVNLVAVPADVETVVKDGKAREVATYSATIDSARAIVDIGIRYDEDSNVFDLIKFRAMVPRDSVYVERIEREIVKTKPPIIGLSAGIRTMHGKIGNKLDVSAVGVDLGIKIVGKYTISAGLDSDGTLSARLGIDF